MIIRISDRRERGDPGSAAWWAAARKNAAAGLAPHGINLLVLNPAIKHIDVFPKEYTEVWEWARKFDGWEHAGRTQLKGEPLDTLQSRAAPATVDDLQVMRLGRPPAR